MVESKYRAGFGQKPALAVVDVTRQLADPAVPGHLDIAVQAAEQIARLLSAARRAQTPVFFTRGGRNYCCSTGAPLSMTERGAWLFKSPLVEKSPEEADLSYQFPSVFGVQPGEIVISKSCPSAFFGTMLASYLLRLGTDTLVIAGMHTSACIRATVTDAFSYGFRVILPAECIADRRSEAHLFHLQEMDEKYADVLPLSEVVNYFVKPREGGNP
jgi:maleamate amidohydrolase